MGSINVKNLGKAYKHYPTRWSRLREWLTPGSRQYHQLKWVLQDINFTVQPGEAVGIIGINGAGKSTLLKLITGTTQPTTGSVTMTGRVAAMLELGMGFHPDFTGRQNVLMAGQLLGLGADEITRLMPEIEAFAEIGDYIDMPVRVYSSGMQMRLAFSVATAVRPDILIVDEALSVGDSYFQYKSLRRIKEFRDQGTTLLFVSHDRQAIINICNRAILINKGTIALEAEPQSVMDLYNAFLADQTNVSQEKLSSGLIRTVSGNGKARVASIKLLNSHLIEAEIIQVGEVAQLKIDIEIFTTLPKLVFGFGIKDRLGQTIFGTNTYHHDIAIFEPIRGDRFTLKIKFPINLGPGEYFIQTSLHSDQTHESDNYEWLDLAHSFSVVNADKKHFIGLSWLDCEIEAEKL
jgi:lipopolysaccharide transport system ATP-binding protein